MPNCAVLLIPDDRNENASTISSGVCLKRFVTACRTVSANCDSGRASYNFGNDTVTRTSRPFFQSKPTSGFIPADVSRSDSTALAYRQPSVSVLIMSQAGKPMATTSSIATLNIRTPTLVGSTQTFAKAFGNSVLILPLAATVANRSHSTKIDNLKRLPYLLHQRRRSELQD